ncbi:kinesin-like protein KIN-14L isoform X2 [Salvia splendens]|uniref:kinesin-like protein KIN-14L isoform X2 n=1 Tax=Salvia splendens TaxID=180675 RepID=UPI001C259579|nr:kinesin-like protein KIN-14L isoform X2 [Salvia splendens]
MEDSQSRGAVGVLDLASRRAEEAALRRYQAVHWLDYLVGPLGIPSQPSEKQFISCLRNGLVLCNIINKVQPGSVPKVIEKTTPLQSLPWDSQPLPAYQYFENIRNFLVAVEELKLPIFDASVFERENLVQGSSIKVVDCILALKDYHEWKQMTGGFGVYKPPRSPLILNSAGRICPRTPSVVSSNSSRRLDVTGSSNKPVPSESNITKVEDVIVKVLAEHMVCSKENIDNNLIASYRSGKNPATFLNEIISSFEEEFKKKYPEVKFSMQHLRERSSSPLHVKSVPLADLSNLQNHKCCRACLKKGTCNHWNQVKQQEGELLNIKSLLSSAKQEAKCLQAQIQSDLKQLGDQVLEMSSAALGYQKAVAENRKLYNMVQDLKGNIRVYCRIRPVSPEVQNVIDFIGEDGSLVVKDPKPLKDGKKIFQFNHVFGPSSSQDEVFRDTQSLVRSVMDGYNVCMFAYGQTGSGKTHTMYGPPGGSTKEWGISYLALNDLFKLSDQRSDLTKYEIQVQMVEIYNEQVHDLLAEDSGVKKLEIRSCMSENGLALPDATLRPVKSTMDVINLMKLGDMRRSIGSTAINSRSSRSHSVLSVHVYGADTSGSMLRSCLHLVDLAGSERVDKSEVTGDGLREAQHINKSLSCLVDVITALAQKNSHIPYRNSKLTLLLQNSLGGNSKTLMLAHVNPEGDSFGETMSTLKFAQRVSTVELGAARANKESSSEVLELKAQIESLRRALDNKEIRTPPMTKATESARTTTERTPPRVRRLSIENGSYTALEKPMNYDDRRAAKTPSAKPKQTERTPPPKSRRLSIENSTPIKAGASMNYDDRRAAKTPSAKPKDTEQTPPPKSRRLSIENGTTVTAGASKNHEEKGAKTPSTNTRSRRLSLEGPRNVQKDSNLIKSPKPVTKISKPEVRSLQNHSQLDQRAPRSPISYSVKSPMIQLDTANMRVIPLQTPKTPEPQIKSRNEVQRPLATDSGQTPSATHGKGSQIRKSLRTIGKFINGSEKRNQQQQPAKPMTPFKGTGKHDPKSPTSSNPRALRRQSLTSIQPPERSRRSSIGGIPTDPYGNESVNAKTPPPVRASTKLTKRWL